MRELGLQRVEGKYTLLVHRHTRVTGKNLSVVSTNKN